MTSLVRWAAGVGQGLTWGSAFSTEINSLGAAQSVLSSVVVTNGTALDLYADVSFSLTGTTGSVGALFRLHLFPLNQDGTTYGDGTQSTAATTSLSPGGYLVGTALPKPSVTSGVLVGMFQRIVMPPGSYSFVLENQTGNALSSSGNTIKYRTYVETVNG